MLFFKPSFKWFTPTSVIFKQLENQRLKRYFVWFDYALKTNDIDFKRLILETFSQIFQSSIRDFLIATKSIIEAFEFNISTV